MLSVMCVWKYCRANPGEMNAHSTVTNNLADIATGGTKFNFNTGKPLKPLEEWP